MTKFKMNLRAYLACKGISLKKFAESLGYGKEYIASVGTGYRNSNPRLSKLIFNATEGQVWIEPKKTNKKQSLQVEDN